MFTVPVIQRLLNNLFKNKWFYNIINVHIVNGVSLVNQDLSMNTFVWNSNFNLFWPKIDTQVRQLENFGLVKLYYRLHIWLCTHKLLHLYSIAPVSTGKGRSFLTLDWSKCIYMGLAALHCFPKFVKNHAFRRKYSICKLRLAERKIFYRGLPIAARAICDSRHFGGKRTSSDPIIF